MATVAGEGTAAGLSVAFEVGSAAAGMAAETMGSLAAEPRRHQAATMVS